MATSIEKWNLHKRVALKMVMLVGVNPAWYVLNSLLKDNNTCGKLCIPEIISYCFFYSRNPAFLFYSKQIFKLIWMVCRWHFNILLKSELKVSCSASIPNKDPSEQNVWLDCKYIGVPFLDGRWNITIQCLQHKICSMQVWFFLISVVFSKFWTFSKIQK